MSLSRCLNLMVLIGILLFAVLQAQSVIIGVFVGELAALCYVLWHYRDNLRLHIPEVSPGLARSMLMYGMPLMILESLGLIMRLSDRYLIEAMLGVDALGQYAASYNLTSYLDIIILAALLNAIRPAYMQLWESQGREVTQAFLSRGLRLYSVIGIPLLALFALTSPHLLSFLAGSRYAEGTVIIPYVAMSFWLDGALAFMAAGLYIFKETRTLMLCSLLATVLNIALNILLIPYYGIVAAAVVTVVSYVFFLVIATALSFRHLRFRMHWRRPLFIAVVSAAVCMSLDVLSFNSELANLLVKGVLGSAILLFLICRFDAECRDWLSGYLARWFPRRLKGV